MAGNRRMPRQKATAALSALLGTICAGGAHADCVTAVYVFGSQAPARAGPGTRRFRTCHRDGPDRHPLRLSVDRGSDAPLMRSDLEGAVGWVGEVRERTLVPAEKRHHPMCIQAPLGF